MFSFWGYMDNFNNNPAKTLIYCIASIPQRSITKMCIYSFYLFLDSTSISLTKRMIVTCPILLSDLKYLSVLYCYVVVPDKLNFIIPNLLL